MVRPGVLRTVGAFATAGRRIDVARRRLLRPADAAGFHVEGDDRVARWRRGMGVVVARRHVEQAAAGIDRRSRDRKSVV